MESSRSLLTLPKGHSNRERPPTPVEDKDLAPQVKQHRSIISTTPLAKHVPKKRKYANGSSQRITKAQRIVTSHDEATVTRRHQMLTRQITTSFSRNAVFDTIELFEKIILHLPLEDIITVRQVNRHWNAVIFTSPRILRALFLYPSSTHRFWVFDQTSQALRTYNGNDHILFGSEWADRQNIIVPAQVNSMLFKANSPSDKGRLVQRAEFCETIRFKASPDLNTINSLYHKMFVCLPPVKAVQFRIHYRTSKPGRGRFRHYGGHTVRGYVENEHGVTFGDIVQAFLMETRANRNTQANGDLTICAKLSMIWMLGVIFATEEEVKAVEKVSEQAPR